MMPKASRLSTGLRRALCTALCLAAILAADLAVHGAPGAAAMHLLHRPAPDALQHLFWDTEPYCDGIARLRAGLSPYRLDDLWNPLPFAYPPLFARAGAGLARVLPAPLGWCVYLTLYGCALVGMQMLLGAALLRPMVRPQWPALLLLTPLGLFLSTAFLSGNIHVVWLGGAALAAWLGVVRRVWWPFWAIALVASVNQPVFLLLLLFPAFVARRPAWVAPGLVVLLAGAAYLAQRILDPVLFAAFQQTVAAHLAVSRDYGHGVFGIAAWLLGPAGHAGLLAAAVAQAGFSVALLAALLHLRGLGVARGRLWWALVALAVVLANPRIMPYDAALGLIPAMVFLVERSDSARRRALLLTVTAASIAAHRHVGFTPVLLAAFLVGVMRLLADHAAGDAGCPVSEAEVAALRA